MTQRQMSEWTLSSMRTKSSHTMRAKLRHNVQITIEFWRMKTTADVQRSKKQANAIALSKMPYLWYFGNLMPQNENFPAWKKVGHFSTFLWNIERCDSNLLGQVYCLPWHSMNKHWTPLKWILKSLTQTLTSCSNDVHLFVYVHSTNRFVPYCLIPCQLRK